MRLVSNMVSLGVEGLNDRQRSRATRAGVKEEMDQSQGHKTLSWGSVRPMACSAAAREA